ncbi:MAG: asparaginase [Bacteroidetes bacterium]|nr:asparaginase [Bacteroidota bacterium]
MSIYILVTGGTFDKEYDMINGKLYFDETHIPEILDLGRSKLNVRVRTLMMIDSLDMTEQDRVIIRDNCARLNTERIVITHGTDTMVQTAAVIAEAELPKTVIITGALIPYKFGSSDGFFNLGNALAFAQTLPHGVYIAMNGRCFQWNEVQKNKSTGYFEEIT